MGTKHGTHRDFTVDDHLKTSKEILTAVENLTSAWERCQKRLGKSQRVTEKLNKLVSSGGFGGRFGGGNNTIKDIKSDLSLLVDDETLSRYGWIYYEERRDKK